MVLLYIDRKFQLMKKFALLTILFLAIAGISQNQKYHRVKIYGTDKQLAELAATGICMDHGDHKKNTWFESDFSEEEIALIKKSALRYEITISDVSSYYANRNLDSKLNAVQQLVGGCGSVCPTYPVPSNFTFGTMGGFYKLNEMYAVLDSMSAKFPNLITPRLVADTAHTFEGRPLYYLKISDNPNMNENEPQVLFTSLHHAREAESLSQLIYFMWVLLENYNTNPEIQYLVNNMEIYFIPCVNPDGYNYNATTNPTGGGMWRKNRRNNGDGTFGIDLNRNYGFMWGFDNVGSSPNTNQDTYRGTGPFSEKETQIVKRFCEAHQFKIALNNHTYSNVLIYPWGYDNSLYTDDSLAFWAMADRLTKCNGFLHGTANETVGYTANGVSDDWMYGEQGTKPKIFAMTPEAGDANDGFWPAQNRIIPIAQSYLDQNLSILRLALNYASIKSKSSIFFKQIASYETYSIKRIGLEPGNFTVSIIPVTSNITSTGAPKVYNGMNYLQEISDSILITLNAGTPQGSLVQYIINVNNGVTNHTDTVSRYYGTPVTIFSDNCNSYANWTGTPWNISTAFFTSPTGSITDSPSGLYNNSANANTTLQNFISLSNAVVAVLSFDAKWEIESGWDYAQVLASSNGTTYTPLCGKYTKTGNANQSSGKPIYDGTSDWVREQIDISNYVGGNLKLRFKLASDNFLQMDGFYFDDLKIEVIQNTTGINNISSIDNLMIFPNPANQNIFIRNGNVGEELLRFEFLDGLGRTILSQDLKSQDSQIDTQNLPAGIYLYKISAANGKVRTGKLMIEH